MKEVSALASSRLTLQGGDFFKDPLPRCDAYILMEIIHDWPDHEAVAILKAVRQVALPGAVLFLIEAIVPEGPEPDWSKNYTASKPKSCHSPCHSDGRIGLVRSVLRALR